MNAIIISNISLLVCALAGFAYGLIMMYRKKQPLYFKLMVFPIACQVFVRAFYVITLLCYGELPNTFNLGLFGFAAFLLFLYLPNVGVMDHLLDEKRKGFTKQKLLSLIVPFAELAAAVFVFVAESVSPSVRITFAVLTVIAGFAGYFNMKHLLIPDVEDGILKALKKFNLICVLLEIFTLAEVGFYYLNFEGLIVIQILLGILYIAFLPFLNKEIKKWIQ